MPTPVELQNLNITSAFIELFELDCTNIGGSIYRFTANAHPSGGGGLSFGTKLYLPMPIVTSGWDFTATGTTPKPTLSISNVNKTLMGPILALGDLVGSKLTRVRTFARYLDDGETPSSTTFIGPDVYFVEQKTVHTNSVITWQMTSIIDRMGMKIPRRQVLKDPTPLTPQGFPGVSRTRIR